MKPESDNYPMNFSLRRRVSDLGTFSLDSIWTNWLSYWGNLETRNLTSDTGGAQTSDDQASLVRDLDTLIQN